MKMVDFRAITGKFLLFYTGLTGLDYTLTVTDSVTGAVRTYESPGDFCGSARRGDLRGLRGARIERRGAWRVRRPGGSLFACRVDVTYPADRALVDATRRDIPRP